MSMPRPSSETRTLTRPPHALDERDEVAAQVRNGHAGRRRFVERAHRVVEQLVRGEDQLVQLRELHADERG
ncbi:MAG: hypothetical protein LC774_15405 [Acidobacteria bacterium]|nr:hypothetical protein [Acidobacteriota bacterium]